MTRANGPRRSDAPLSPERWAQLRALVEEALTRPREDRTAFLDASCGDDDALRDRVGRLADSCERGAGSWGFLAHPAGDLAAALIAADGTAIADSDARSNQPPQAFSAALADRYAVGAEVGRGGMATVYVAEDLRHQRRVAIKVLDPQLGAMLGAERFLTEIRVTAGLQHPNLLPLFDSGEAGGLLYYVMPLIEGATLRARIQRERQLPVDDAVRIARAIAGALDYAHRQGVVHRDLKPENILLQDGEPLVADFGISLAVTRAAGSRLTATGMSLGTPSYMSPEQAAVDPSIDGRSDIYSLASVLYEMLVGDPPFTGSTVQAVIARVLVERPSSVRTVRPSVPAHVDAALARALSKLPADRYATAREFSDALLIAPAVAAAGSRSSMPAWRRRALQVLGAVAAVGLATAAWMASRTPPATSWFVDGAFAAARWVVRPAQWTGRPLVRLDVQIQTAGVLGSEVGTGLIISPDGSRVVFVSIDSAGVTRLRTRRLDGSPPIDLPGTQGGRSPFFSPDGRWIGFWAAGQIRKTSVDGGSPVVLSDATDLLGASWGDDGVIIAALNSTGKLWRLSSAGGVSSVVLDLEADGSAPRWPQLLPGGKLVLYTATTGVGADRANIEVARLKDGKRTIVIKGGTYGRYVAPGYLTYVNQGTLYAAPFDLDRLEARTPGTPILDDVAYSATFGYAQMDVSSNGIAVYRRSSGSGQLVVSWLDSTGRATRLIDVPGRYLSPALSPDGSRLALSVVESGVRSVSIFGKLSDPSPQLVAKLMGYSAAVWSPNGQFLIAIGNTGLARIDASGGTPRLISDSKAIRLPWSFTPDGHRIAVHAMSATTAFDLWTIAVDDTGTGLHAGPPQIILQTRFFEVYPAISPDGRWLAHSSNESGAWEVYVRAFPDDGTKVQVSRGGGRIPRWSRDGRELFYSTDDQRLMVATNASVRDTFVSGVPRLWMPLRLADTGVLPNYDLAPGGRRIVALVPAGRADESPQENHVTLMLNFTDELRRRTAPH